MYFFCFVFCLFLRDDGIFIAVVFLGWLFIIILLFWWVEYVVRLGLFLKLFKDDKLGLLLFFFLKILLYCVLFILSLLILLV